MKGQGSFYSRFLGVLMTYKFIALLAAASFMLAGPVAATEPMVTPPAGPSSVVVSTDPVLDAAGLDGIPAMTTLDGELPLGEFPLLRLTPDKIEVVKLEQNATNVLVGNNRHLLAVIETPRQVLLIPRTPGATHLQILDAKGATIFERSVIIASPRENYVRIRRSCATQDNGTCMEYSVFFCPDMCHSVTVPQAAQQMGNAAVPTETAGGGGSGMTEGNPGEAGDEVGSVGSDVSTATSNSLMIP
jgi:hypothetical protein